MSPAASHYHLANEVKGKDKDKDTPDLACLKQLIALPWSMIADLETGILEFCSEFRLISERKGKDNKCKTHGSFNPSGYMLPAQHSAS